MNWKEIESEIIKLKLGLKHVMGDIALRAAEEPKIPDPSRNFDEAEKALDGDTFDVVVCGEVKKGKSSFINAIIGDNILPVAQDIATSQVFKLSNSTDGKEHYKLVFTDTTEKTISREDLDKYGSQIYTESNGVPELDGKSLSYIDVQIPTAFLPTGVNIVDTPGLGALYKSHEFITQTYIKNASAVIFVLNYDSPIVELEASFIEKILDVTPYVLFIITMSDKFDEQTRNLIISRDEAILEDIFKKRNLPAPKLMPVSSTLLMAASKKEKEMMRKASLRSSGYTDVESRLMSLIFKAAGLLPTDNAFKFCVNYVNRVNEIIRDILQACKTDSNQTIQEIEAKKMKLQQEFQDEWNEHGTRRSEVLSQIDQACDNFVNEAITLVSPSGPLYKGYIDRIDKADSISSAKSLGNSLPNEFIAEIKDRWSGLNYDVQRQIRAIIASSNYEMEQSISAEGINVHSDRSMDFDQNDYINVFKSGGGIMVTFAALNIVFNPGAWAAIIAACLVAIVLGPNAIVNQIKKKTKEKLRDLLDDAARQIPSSARTASKELKSLAVRIVKDDVASRRDEIQAELNDIQERGQMELDEKLREYKKWETVQQQWAQIANALQELVNKRNEIRRTLNESI